MERGARWTGQISIFMFHLVHMVAMIHIVHAVPRIPPVHRGVLWKITSKKRFMGASKGKIDKKTTKNNKIQQRRQHKLKKMIFGDFVSQLYKL